MNALVSGREVAAYYSVPVVAVAVFLAIGKPEWALGVALIYVLSSTLCLAILWRER